MAFSVVAVALTGAAGVFVDAVAAGGVIVVAAVWVLVNTTTCDPVTLLSVYLMLLVLIPSRFVFAPLGAIGTPAVLVGLVAGGWWVTSRLIPSLARSAEGVQPIRTVILVFGWLTVLTYGFAFMRALNGIESRSADRTLIGLVALCGTALLAADGIATRARLEVLLRRFVIAAVILAAMGIVQFTSGVDPSQLLKFPGLRLASKLRPIQEGGAVRRVASTALHPIEFGVVLTMALPLALHFAFHAPPEVRKRRWIAVMVIAFAVPMSVSRSAVLGLSAVFLVLIPGWSWRRRVNVAASMGFICVAMQAVIPGLLGTIRSLILNASTDPSVQGRTDDYGPLFDLWRETPWLGRGLGTFDPGSYRFLDNQYLGTLIDSGIVGLVALILLLLVVTGTARGAKRRSPDPELQSLARSLLAAVVAAATTFATFDALSFPMNAGVLFVLIGSIGALWRLVYVAQRAARAAPASTAAHGQEQLVRPEEVHKQALVQ